MHKFVSTPRGLTLIEIMGALAVSAILLSGVWQLFQGGLRSYHRGLQDVRMMQGARALLTLVTRDMQRAMATRAPYGIRSPAQQTAAQATAGQPADRLEMIMAPTPGQEGQDRGAPQRIRYVLTALSEGKTLALQRAVAGTDGTQPERFMPLHNQVQTFTLRYFDGQTWYDEWQQAELPRALELTIVLQSGGIQPRTYRFATLVTAD